MECIQNDLNLVKEWKYNVEKERKRVKRIYNQLLDDKQQFKQDYNDLKYLNNESEEYSSKRSSLKRVKQILDSKITSVNLCIKSINKSEGMLLDFERGLASRLKKLSMDEFQFVDYDDDHNQNGMNRERYYNIDGENDQMNLDGIDEDVKEK